MRMAFLLAALSSLALTGCAGPARISAAEMMGGEPEAAPLRNEHPSEDAAARKPKSDSPPPNREAPYFDEATATWFLSKSDYSNLDSDDLARYCRTVVDQMGTPIGVQISDDIPADHILLKRGLKPADVVKSVNGAAVVSISDVRRIVRQLYNSGVTRFELKLERDGLELTLRCVAPAQDK